MRVSVKNSKPARAKSRTARIRKTRLDFFLLIWPGTSMAPKVAGGSDEGRDDDWRKTGIHVTPLFRPSGREFKERIQRTRYSVHTVNKY